jgi:hypothetical protein
MYLELRLGLLAARSRACFAPPPGVLVLAGFRFRAPGISLWGAKFSATRGARGVFRLNESTTTTREAWVCCLLIRARTAATLGCVVVARRQQL